jgi:hypothetical protein
MVRCAGRIIDLPREGSMSVMSGEVALLAEPAVAERYDVGALPPDILAARSLGLVSAPFG